MCNALKSPRDSFRRGAAMFLWTILLFIASEVTSSTKRVKRVLNGEVIDVNNQANYAVTSYYATYASLHDYPWYSWSPWSYGNKKFYAAGVQKGHYGEIFCGGALLTPAIVQTACHCVSTWRAPNRPSFVRRPSVDHQWEQVRVIYTGVYSRFRPDPSMISQKPIQSLQFIVHEECGKLSGTDQDPNSYDYAWIKVDASWTYPGSGVPTYRTAFALIYEWRELDKIKKQILEMRAVCLHIGFGWYAPKHPRTSLVLLHGWSAITSLETCVSKTAGGVPKIFLNDLMNWFCVETYSQHLQPTQHGDSGSPVTCNDQYFGVVSGHRGERYLDEYNRFYDIYWSLHGHVSETPYSMTTEFRERFSQEISDAGVKNSVDVIREETHYTLARRARNPEVRFRRFSQSKSSYARMESSAGLTLIPTSIVLVLHH